MTLVGMLRIDEEALICDLAETYHIFDYKALPLKTVALLASGLRDSARIKMKICEQRAPIETILLAAAVDRLTTLLWLKTEDGHKGRRRPKSIAQQLLKKEEETASFDSIEAFEKKRNELLRRKGG